MSAIIFSASIAPILLLFMIVRVSQDITPYRAFLVIWFVAAAWLISSIVLSSDPFGSLLSPSTKITLVLIVGLLPYAPIIYERILYFLHASTVRRYSTFNPVFGEPDDPWPSKPADEVVQQIEVYKRNGDTFTTHLTRFAEGFYPKTESDWNYLSLILRRERLFTADELLTNRFLSIYPKNRSAILRLATYVANRPAHTASSVERKLMQVRSLFNLVLSERTIRYETYVLMGDLYRACEAFEDACQVFRFCLSARPTDFDVRRKLVLALIASGHPRAAKAELARLSEYAPNDIAWRLIVVDCATRLKAKRLVAKYGRIAEDVLTTSDEAGRTKLARFYTETNETVGLSRLWKAKQHDRNRH